MANAPLNVNVVIDEVKTELLNMEFDVDDFDEHGNKTGSHRAPVVDGNGIDQLATAIGTALFKVLKDQVIIQVNVQTPVPATPGVFTGVGNGLVK